jgi:proton-translocating NAD(P)+ transhydrogenase subunit beta
VNYLVIALYVISFGLFIYGLMGLTGPKTAVRGNLIAAVGMALAVTATLIKIRHTDQWPLIIAGLVVGVVLGVPPARLTKMTAMPQLVAFFNGVGGGTVALIALAEFIETDGFSAFQHGESPTAHIVVASLFAAIIGSISFWGSIIAFGKLQEIISGSPIGLGKAQQLINLLLLAAAVAAAIVIGLGARPGTGGVSLWWMIGLLAAAGALGLMVVLPIGGADMPVVISLLNAMTGLSAAAAGLALNNTAMIVAGMIVGASGSILTNLMAKAMNRSIPAIVAGGFGGGGVAPTSDAGGDKHVRSTSAADAAIQMAYANQVIVVPGYGLAVAGEVRDSPGCRPDARAHERAAGGGRSRLRRDEGHGRHQRRIRSHRRHGRDRSQRRHQPGGTQRGVQPDLRHADPQRGQVEIGDRAQAVDEFGIRRYRQPALLRGRHHDAVR